MRFWFFVKLLAALAVIGVMGFTGMLAYHVTVTPLGGIFEKIIPNPGEIAGGKPDVEFAKMLDTAELPDIEPGRKVFEKAHELIALGNLPEAREKLGSIINIFPGSPDAPKARRIVGEMNLDEILSTSHPEGKETYTVRRGDSYLAIVGRSKTSLDMLVHLNGLMELRNLQPGDELIVMPLDFRLLLEPRRKAISLWDGGRFIREYPIVEIVGPTPAAQRTTIESKSGLLNGRRILPEAKGYRGADKIIQIAKVPLPVRAMQKPGGDLSRGIYLQPADLEELSLLTRTGNEVEIR